MLEPIGICKGQGIPLYRMVAAKDVLEVSRIGKHFHCLLNRRAILSAKSEKELIERCAPVMVAVARIICQKNKLAPKHGGLDVKYAGLTNELVKFVNEGMDNAEIYVLDEKPDELQENMPKEDLTTRQSSFNGYSGYIAEISENVNNVQHLSDVLFKTHLAKDMWGSKDVSTIINGVKTEMAKLGEYSDTMDKCFEQSGTNAKFVQTCVANQRYEQARTAAGKVIEDFSTIKTYLAELAQTLQKLYVIDATFKKFTGYPATWFIMSSILMDFLFEFESLIGNIVKTSSVEANTIEPLLVWKIKSTGDR